MRNILIATLLVSAAALAPAYCQDDKAKTWCTDAHMQKMADDIAKMSDAAKKKEADTHLAMSKAAMQANDMEGCVQHMEETHKAMGL